MHASKLFPTLLCALLASLPSSALLAQAGTLDASFDGDGTVITDFMTGYDGAAAMALQPDGKILSVGYATGSQFNEFGLTRHLPDGSLDTTFSGDGRQLTDVLTFGDDARAVAIQADGRIVVSGYAYNDLGLVNSAVARYLPNGTLDSTFNDDGLVIIEYVFGGSAESSANAVAVQADGKIVVAGGANIGPDVDFALARLNTDGSLDNTFSFDGKVTTDLGSDADACLAIAIQPDGRIVVSGFSYDGVSDDVSVARYNTDGSLDTGFSGDGMVTTELGPGGGTFRGLALQPDGRIVVAGSAGYFDLAVVRYNTDGTLDFTFNGAGMVTSAMSFGCEARSVAVQPDGRIVVAGYVSTAMGADILVVRYNEDGTFDNSFAGGGVVYTDLGPNDDGYDVLVQPDGKILVAGTGSNGTNADFALLRYLSGLDIGLIDLSHRDRSVLVYPNPMEDAATLQYALGKEETISIRLLDVEGRVLHSFIENSVKDAGAHQQLIELPKGLASGAYVLVVSSSTGQVGIRVVK